MKSLLVSNALAAFLLMAGISVSLVAQENQESEKRVQIEIVNQDGEKVQAQTVVPDAQTPRGIRVESKNGKMIIVDSDGNRRELQLDGAANIIVQQSVQSVDNNGDKQTIQGGKVVIVGPDGKRQEIDLGDGNVDFTAPNIDLLVPKGSGVFRMQQNIGKYMIGVFCEPVREAMTAQLRLPSGTGLLVGNLTDDSPAAKAGLKKHDVIVYANEAEMKTLSDLSKVVEEAGGKDSSVVLSIIRGGKESEISVKPVQRPKNLVSGSRRMIFDEDLLPGDAVRGVYEFRTLEPGVILGPDFKMDEDMRAAFEQQMKQIEAQMQEMRQRMEQQFNDKN